MLVKIFVNVMVKNDFHLLNAKSEFWADVLNLKYGTFIFLNHKALLIVLGSSCAFWRTVF